MLIITPTRGKRIFGFLLILAGLGILAALGNETLRARSRTSSTTAHILSSFRTGKGIGPLRQDSISIRYEFFVNGLRFEQEQLVDNLDAGIIYVQFDPQQPKNNRLDLPDSTAYFNGVLAGVFLMIGIGLMVHTWRPITLFKPLVR